MPSTTPQATSPRARRVVVVGGGIAGVRLTQRLAALGRHEVTLIGEEAHAPYNRVLLAEVLAGRYPPEVIALPPAGAEWRGGLRAVRIDRADRLVGCDDKSTVPYDTLVLATGANPVLPPLRGLTGPAEGGLPDGVHAFRTMDDCLALSAASAVPGARAVVVGGGLLGVSAARALAARGVRVVLAQQSEYLMDRHLDAESAGLVRTRLETAGVEVHTACRVRGLLTSAGAVKAVELSDGYRLGAEIVVLACGTRPRVGLATAAGLDVARGIVVDDALRTSDPDIYAIGDCAEHNGTLYGLANAARDQADLLARHLGDPEPAARVPAPARAAARYRGTRALTRLTLPALTAQGPLDIAAFGEPEPAAGDDVVRIADATRGTYRKVVLRGDRLVGGILVGDLGTVGALAHAWEDDEPLPSTPLHLLHPALHHAHGGS